MISISLDAALSSRVKEHKQESDARIPRSLQQLGEIPCNMGLEVALLGSECSSKCSRFNHLTTTTETIAARSSSKVVSYRNNGAEISALSSSKAAVGKHRQSQVKQLSSRLKTLEEETRKMRGVLLQTFNERRSLLDEVHHQFLVLQERMPCKQILADDVLAVESNTRCCDKAIL